MIACQPIISVDPSTALGEAAQLMLRNGTSHLAVIDPETQRPIGIQSTLDIAGTLAWGEA